ncbi:MULTISPECIES: methylated-DNA--[protein]-cysteine S-methyltransferase [Micromonospora]|uniref:Methylated-DNA--protein-cysteine methyltransferase n=1 Tax=Micromonospora solifontis TaxID=2487138 RepID=A0ABX9WDJ6_9ACTN|nr:MULTISPECIES: methylated-DNA--[protein]-cysteine S-methyltransferase [Micromonospora]NES16238.1 methylated-DNA--[protein]-cysteine S-methyltransferase [Micromonospora sp. PPF5-17B]NES38107.1 methylated-DNA--[protein]-cysteine S-methyltransferase [Micromonospora solifontis]NES57847.1 methylated-DNA--[protein]-cysteine S-methyltransferase [Micromonospora sp. PPF5-6]RNL97043.1 methylated-DNA--[protein]-cysteine S-methyltransferase [Micromonospora solifontis]
MRWTVLDSPIGEFSVATDGEAVRAAHFGRVAAATGEPGDAVAGRALAELRAYFAGELTEFTVPVAVPRGSEFERAVWREMTRIPYGETLTYGEVAKAVGDPGAARAVGVACNRNPVPVIVPCHRIVGAGGKLVGFGGGLPRKVTLLELEAAVALRRAWLS